MTAVQAQLDLQLLSTVLRHDLEYHTILAQAHDRGRWILFYGAKTPGIPQTNKAGLVRVGEDELEGFLQEVEAFYRDLGARPACYLDPATRPGGLAQRLEARGYRPEGKPLTLMRYQGGPVRPPEYPDIRLHVATYHEWRDYVEVASQWQPDRRLRAEWAWRAHQECADPRVRNYIAYMDGRPAAVLALFAWGDVGRLESLRVAGPFVKTDVAGALVHKAIHDSRNMKNRLTYVLVQGGEDRQGLYEPLEFGVVAEGGWETWVRD